MGAIEFLSSQADKILIGLYLAARPVGIYVLASTLAAFVPIILQSVNQIFAPIIADLHAQRRQDVLQKLFQTLTKWIVGMTLPLALVVIAFAAPLMRLFGPDFETGWPVLVIATVGQIVNCAVGSVGNLLLMSGNQKRLMKVQFAMAAISIVVNVSLIPVLGIIGAALAAAIVNVGSNLWNLLEVRKALHLSPYNAGYYRLLLPTALVVSALAVLRILTASIDYQWPVILLALLLGYGLFGAAALRFGLDSDDRLLARDAWQQLCAGWERLGVRS
jgi:O-antigen/teichoic acid export membrane protein